MNTGRIHHFCFRNGLNLAHQEGFGLCQLLNPCAANAGNQNTQVLTLCMKYLLYHYNGADGIEVFQRGIIIHNVPLGNQHDILITLHGFLKRLYGLDSANIKVDRLVREYCQPTQSQHRESPGN